MKRQEKESIVAEVSEKISRARSIYLTDFTGLTVQEANELRREFRKSGVDYRVVKNTLVRRALGSVGGYDRIGGKLSGPTAIALSYDDPVSPAKVIKKFIEKYEKPKVKACIVESQIYEGSKLNELAKLPSRGELIASILGAVQSPIAGIIGAVQAVARDLVIVLHAIEEKKKASV